MSHAFAAEASILLCGYNVGFFDKADIVKWADHQIEAVDEPSMALLDLSMIRGTHPIDVMNLLRAVGPSEPIVSIPTQIGFLGLLYERKRIGTCLVIRGLYALLQESGVTEEQRQQIYYLDDGYDLALTGHESLGSVEHELLAFVMPYAEQLATHYSHLIPNVS